MPTITLKIDVDTYRGSREGTPNLVRLLSQHKANATFLFSLGPDHTGWALRRAFKPGFFQKVSRTSVLEHYGLKTLMYGVLLPAPDIGLTCAAQLRAVAEAGFECGIHTWDHVLWQDNVRQRDAAWTKKQMQQSVDRFTSIFGVAPKTHGAAGWQMNPHAFAELDNLGMAYSSDGRAQLHEDGSLVEPHIGPYRLSIADKTLNCIQMPTTLPTLDELLGRTIDGKVIELHNIAEHILKLTKQPRDHVFTLHAELEGQKLAPIFEKLLIGWQAQGYQCSSMAEYASTIAPAQLPSRPLHWAELPGRSGELIMA
ncbi:polysaccharide deacetylase family protein [Solimicrobium silvestre]|uniref:Polysaccharide deacetylase n=1 Tax=Solimicrobium silvestre TaxID=2099400 RepID=A0A2S9GX40_9BURK|nr:polysaccharide deacetylase family protein [Solimicrobium silvestre]PRC92268.1 Polysaccharide deacetylase [Solimicrobium silvestre]